MQSQARSLYHFRPLPRKLVAPPRRVGATRRREPREGRNRRAGGTPTLSSQIPNRTRRATAQRRRKSKTKNRKLPTVCLAGHKSRTLSALLGGLGPFLGLPFLGAKPR